ncbi:uncharacterized protein TNCV_4206831 [Trichonephila clavipes]|nr:uncharacterized protein TNCV_4206831 [Trichonephila clavipes]
MCSRCESVGHASTDCSLEQKCVNCSQPHSFDSKQCPKWKIEKEIQAIKTNRNLSYLEARKLKAPRLSQTYAQVAKSSTATSTTQTGENITQIKCPPLQLLQPLLSIPQPNKSNSVSTLLSTTQADLLPPTSLIADTVSELLPPIPVFDTLLSTIGNMFTPIEPSSSLISASSSNLAKNGSCANNPNIPTLTAKSGPRGRGPWLRMARRRGLVRIKKSSLALALDRARQHVMGVSPLSSFEESSGSYT